MPCYRRKANLYKVLDGVDMAAVASLGHRLAVRRPIAARVASVARPEDGALNRFGTPPLLAKPTSARAA